MPAPAEPSATLRTLLRADALALRLLSPGDDGRLDRQIRWTHSSDLADPTPFLADDLVLLTTGTQFAESDDSASVARYVDRLIARGVIALGFGTEVVREGVPASLLAACTAAGLTLFEVPYSTPFIAVARANAEAIAAQAYARRTWALGAQRAISLAALRRDGLGASLAELSRQLDAWVGLYDAAGTLSRAHPNGALSAHVTAGLADEARRLLRASTRAGSALTIDGSPFTLQTLGRGGALRGVLAVGGSDLDQEARNIVTAVVAMTALALEQQQSIAGGRAALRSGVLAALRSGAVELAERVAEAHHEPLPPSPVVVARVSASERTGHADADADAAARAWLELRTTDREAPVVFGDLDGALTVILPPARLDLLDALVDSFGVRIGVSDPNGYDEFPVALAQAGFALEHGAGSVSAFAHTRARGILATLGERSRVIGHALLAPLHDHDAATGTQLLATLETYLRNDGAVAATATELGVHRHTVRARLQHIERLLELDLSAFPVRAELWAALTATAQSHPSG